MKSIIPGDIVEHRTSDDRYVVATTGLVCCVRMLAGARITDFFHPHELEVTEPAERVRGLNYEHCWMAMDAGPPGFDARDGVAEAITCVECGSIFGPRPDPLYGAFRCPQCGAHYQRDGEAEGGIRYIPPLGLREKEGRDTSDPEDSVDVPLHDIHGKRCVSCASWGDASCSRGRPTSRDGSTRACDEWEVRPLRDAMPATTGEPGPIDGQRVPERAELDVEDAREMLKGAGWLLIPPDEALSEDIVDRYASILTQAGVAMMASDVDIVLAGAMVRRGWTVAADEDGSRLYPPEQPAPTQDLPEDFAELLRDVATEKLSKTELLRRVTGSVPAVSCNACNFRATDDCDLETSTGEGECQYFEPTWDDVAVALAGYAIKVKAGAREQDERLSIDEAAGRLHSSGWLLFEPGRGIFEPQPEGGVHPELIQGCEDTLRTAGYTIVAQSELPDPGCYVCRHWDSEAPEPCTMCMTPDYDDLQPCDCFAHRWQDIAEHLSSVIARAHVGENPYLSEDLRKHLDAATKRSEQLVKPLPTMTIGAHIEALCAAGYQVEPTRVCKTCDFFEDFDGVECGIGVPTSGPDSSCDDWDRAPDELQPEAERPPAPAYPTPPTDLDDATFADQLDWLRANEVAVCIGRGRKTSTGRQLKLMRAGLYADEHAELLLGCEMERPPGPAKCPVKGEDGEPCGSETPESCEHPLPAVPGDGG